MLVLFCFFDGSVLFSPHYICPIQVDLLSLSSSLLTRDLLFNWYIVVPPLCSVRPNQMLRRSVGSSFVGQAFSSQVASQTETTLSFLSSVMLVSTCIQIWDSHLLLGLLLFAGSGWGPLLPHLVGLYMSLNWLDIPPSVGFRHCSSFFSSGILCLLRNSPSFVVLPFSCNGSNRGLFYICLANFTLVPTEDSDQCSP